MTDAKDWLDGPDGEDESGVLEPADSLDDRGVADVLDEGWSPAERPWAVNDWGTTAREEAQGESLSGRLARELPEEDRWDGDGLGDAADTDGELIDDEVGDRRSGRLLAVDGGDESHDFYAMDVGVDGAAASAEEAAMHTIPDAYDER